VWMPGVGPPPTPPDETARSPWPRHLSTPSAAPLSYASGNAGGEVGLSICPNPVALSDMRRRSAKLGIAAVVGGAVDLHRPASRSSGESSSLYDETFLNDETSVDKKELLLDLKELLLDLLDLNEAPLGRTDSGDSPMETRPGRAFPALRSEPWRAFDSIDSRSAGSSASDSTDPTSVGGRRILLGEAFGDWFGEAKGDCVRGSGTSMLGRRFLGESLPSTLKGDPVT